MILLGYLRFPRIQVTIAFCNPIPAVRPVCKDKPQKFIVFVPQLTQCDEPESVMNERSINGIARSWILQRSLRLSCQ